MRRRDFINWVGLGGLAASLPIAIAACSPEKSQPESNTSPDWQKVATITELDKTGTLLLEKSPVGALLLVGTSGSDHHLIAVDPTCTHKGCLVEWKTNTKRFACPCHEAEFSPDGKVKKPPAKTPLKTYIAKIQGEEILVKTI
jgi:cytochrome b6-f complex iron-sulfur subunit